MKVISVLHQFVSIWSRVANNVSNDLTFCFPLPQERLQRSLMVCQDKFETAKLQQIRTEAMTGLESCVDQSIQESISTLPHLVEKLKSSLSLRSNV